MNIGKSTRVAMAKRGMRAKELAETLDVTQATVSIMCGRESASGQMLAKLAQTFDMKVSEFVALGED